MTASDPIPLSSGAAYPAVVCPGCGVQMRPSEKRRIAPSSGLVMVTYVVSRAISKLFELSKTTDALWHSHLPETDVRSAATLRRRYRHQQVASKTRLHPAALSARLP